MKPMNLTPLFFLSLFVHILTVHVAPYTPVDDITLNCGSSGTIFNDYDNRTWTGDINSKLSPSEVHQTGPNATSVVHKAPPTSSAPANRVPYTTARLSRAEFSYRFPVTAGQKFIRLYFNPVSYPGFDRSKSFFSVKASGFALLNNFNASVTADAAEEAASGDKTIYREFCLNIEKEQNFNITFIPSTATPDAYAFINGIEIVSMPTNLYYTDAQSDRVRYVGNNNFFPIGNSSALEMVYRIDIGGSAISPNDDTGMYRKWEGMDIEPDYLDDLSLSNSVRPQNSSLQLQFYSIKDYSAPKQVYQTGRSMGMNKTRNKSYQLTWGFPVDPKFSYLVRLHFCEFESTITKAFDRSFVIYIANLTAEHRADIISWTGDRGNGIPIYKDYVVYMAGGSATQKKVNLFIALQASQKDWMTSYNDAILNGLEIFKLNDSNGNLAGPNPDPPPTTTPNTTPQSPKISSNKSSTPLLPIVAGVVSGVLVLSVLGFFIFRRGRKVKDSSSSQGTKWGPLSFSTTKSTKTRGSSLPSDVCRHFSLAEIKAATQNFNDVFIIGVGGFGHVYKGYIDGGATPVAIKRLKSESSQGAHEFMTEIEMLSQLRHLHLVSLVGYCTDDGEMILVYDYMARGTLRDHLYHTDNPPLPWEQRLQICIGAARGLHYLHTGAKFTIIHRDVKSTNILLDEKWVAKVSDFGLSKMGTSNTSSKTHISTMVKGSFGYLDPEYYRRQQLTEKSDVYSFGVVLCEVLCARPPLIRTVEKKQMSLAEWAKSCHRSGTLDQIIDPSLRGKIVNQSLSKFVEIAVSCMRDNGIERPSMNDVAWGLEFALQLQQSADQVGVKCTERKGEDEDEDELALVMNDRLDSDARFSCSWEDSDSKNMSRVTKSSSSEQNSTTNESIKGMSGIVFSEIHDPNGR